MEPRLDGTIIQGLSARKKARHFQSATEQTERSGRMCGKLTEPGRSPIGLPLFPLHYPCGFFMDNFIKHFIDFLQIWRMLRFMSEFGPDIERYPALDAETAQIEQAHPKVDYATSIEDLDQLVFYISPAYEVTARELRIGEEFADCASNADTIATASGLTTITQHFRRAEWQTRMEANRAFAYLDAHPEVINNGRKIATREDYLATLDPQIDAEEYKATLLGLKKWRINQKIYQRMVKQIEKVAEKPEEIRQSAVEAARRNISIHQTIHNQYGAQPECLKPTEQL